MIKKWIILCLAALTFQAGPASGLVIYFGPNLILSSQSVLSFKLAGTNVLTDYDCIDAQRQVTLAGSLNITLIGGFNPQAGDVFNILDFQPGMLTGTFSTINLPTLTGDLQWDISALYTLGELRVYQPCPLTADLTGDCTVNLTDWAVFAGSWLTVSGNSNWNSKCDLAQPVDGTINIADLAVFVGQWLQ